MARLRETGPGQCVDREELLAAAAGTPADASAGASATASDRAGGRASGRAGDRADPRRPERILAGLLADGLAATDDGGATYRLP